MKLNINYLKNYKVVSFDFFDTLVSRKYINPTDIFYKLEAHLEQNLKNFAQNRINAELDCRKKYNFSQEVTLEEIYYQLKEVYNYDLIDNETLTEAMNLEIAIESESLFINTELKELIIQLLRTDTKVIVISDIYLPKNFIVNALNKFEINTSKIKFYISSDIRKMKSDKQLFKYVLKDLDITPSEIIHIGDNLVSDILNAKKLGINAYHYNDLIPNRYERQEVFQGLNLSKLRATSRQLRLDNPYDKTSHKGVIWNTTMNVSAPLMFGFTLWCINMAKKLGISTLYFCSRDGEILYKIAKEIIKKEEVNIEIKYLYVSRQALLFPSIENLAQSLDWIMAPTTILSPRIILKRVNIKPSEIVNKLERYGFHNKLDINLSTQQRKVFVELLLEIEGLIMNKVNDYKETTKGYLRNKRLYNKKFALVDIGWNGTIQRSISKILNEDGYEHPVCGFYFGVKSRRKHKDTDQIYGWFTDCNEPRELDKETYIIPMTELFTAALHGGVNSYIIENDKVTPKLNQQKNYKGLEWGIDVQQQAMIAFAKKVLCNFESIKHLSLDQELDYLEANYSKFILNPTYLEAKTYGSYKDAEDQNESYHLKLAKKYSLMDQIKRVINPRYKHHHNEWEEGALRLTKGK